MDKDTTVAQRNYDDVKRVSREWEFVGDSWRRIVLALGALRLLEQSLFQSLEVSPPSSVGDTQFKSDCGAHLVRAYAQVAQGSKGVKGVETLSQIVRVLAQLFVRRRSSIFTISA